ncbi:DUF5928 domain-containing protein [Pacificibacter marinus]|uniref:Peptide O-xylosyltransferase n=1 Tax=Pacificibacter marinus TaxID=658057 RepID=A0A1Y5S8U1_9RHOB|nr:DUF5928 domain-containing protein [Pacificibacter marinus]SEK75832.1 Core-2/I-Branching enzyme [Pacificibacter marinus]SLN34772.1 Core-2/I-Branching enzyme [Pacificibacter marinus]
MARIAFILLCHKDPEAIVDQARRLTATGDYISIHFDARGGRAAFDQVRQGLKDNPNVTFAKKRIKCGWGAWSLVQASLYAVEAAEEAFPRATHFYMVSGDCMSIKSAEYIHDFLDKQDVDYIESFDFFESDWIKTGIKEERLTCRHWFNERTHKKLFDKNLWLQQRLGLKRDVPSDIQVQIGSQWWCLRRRTIEWILDFTRSRKDVMKFFRTTWIPDETFFQTLVRHLVPENEINARTLTFLMFTDYGMPVVLYNDHYDLLVTQDFMFARKISPDATELKKRLGDLFAAKGVEFQISGEGRSLFKFLTDRGREGRRFTQRFWETESSLGRDRELLMIVCKKWHVAKRLVAKIKEHTDVPCIEYLFNEEDTPLPDLGGIEKSLEKRTRHRRAWVRMLFDYFETNRMVVCLDSDALDLIRDFYNDRSSTRLLEIDCAFSDSYLEGHAKRVGLAGDQTPQDAMERLLPTIRADITHEHDAIRDAKFENIERISQSNTPEENAHAIARFLQISDEDALKIAKADHLFHD